ncbi:hypothetical protein DPMN_071066 [Dreissena polymorpha]|uniref:Uncharacterized protein n=1 Tax=Dreissena polymorpha TaxID=45954 RepID=A0A9D3Z3W4_DREPO|nr:hypothetical protein DPMN_071066 [Dreissena polymorpha]
MYPSQLQTVALDVPRPFTESFQLDLPLCPFRGKRLILSQIQCTLANETLMYPVSCADGVVWIMRRVLYVSDVFGAEHPAPHKRTHAERARNPPPLALAYGPAPNPPPLEPPETSTLIHPLAARDNRSAKNRPRSFPKPHPESPSYLERVPACALTAASVLVRSLSARARPWRPHRAQTKGPHGDHRCDPSAMPCDGVTIGTPLIRTYASPKIRQEHRLAGADRSSIFFLKMKGLSISITKERGVE